MSDFKAKMYPIQFRLGLCPRNAGGAYSTPPDALAGLRGLTSNGRGGEGTEREGRGRDPTLSRPPNPYFWIRLWLLYAMSSLLFLLLRVSC